ncbi:MAG TPA: hypothetical protein VNP89_06275 [Gaiellaceae bacterium]|nr:hypothetical protein [Gaiellaceae bacterium]
MVGRALLACLAALVLPSSTAAQEGPLPGGRGLVAITSLSPSTHLFADPVVARLDVVLDPAQFDPDRLDVRLSFAPYEPVGRVERTRRVVGDLVHLRYEATLRCLHLGCIAPRFETNLGTQEEGRAERHSITLPPVALRYEEDDGRTPVLLTKQFPVAEVVSRINTARLQGLDPDARPGSEGAFVAGLEPPDRTYRVRPVVLGVLALGVAFLLVLPPAVLVGRALRERWRAARPHRPLSPLERALVLVDWTARRDDAEDRRKALEALAVVLEDDGAGSLAGTTRALAWAEPSPAGEQTGAAGTEARRSLAGRDDGRAS